MLMIFLPRSPQMVLKSKIIFPKMPETFQVQELILRNLMKFAQAWIFHRKIIKHHFWEGVLLIPPPNFPQNDEAEITQFHLALLKMTSTCLFFFVPSNRMFFFKMGPGKLYSSQQGFSNNSNPEAGAKKTQVTSLHKNDVYIEVNNL